MLHTLIFSYWKSATFSELTGSRLQMEHSFVVLLPELPCLFFLTIHQQWITPMEEALVDDLELLSFGAFGFLLLISSGWIDFYQLSVWSLLTCTFLFRLVNVCSFAFGIVSWNLVLAGCDSSRSSYFIRLLSNSFNSKHILLYLWKGHFSNGKKYQILLHATEWVKPVTLEHCYQGLNTGLISDNSGALEIGVIEIWFI